MRAEKTKKQITRVISLLTTVFFLVSQVAFANPGAGIEIAAIREMPGFLRIDIPTELASLDGLWEAPPSSDSKVVLHIQNAHANYGAQKKIKELLEYLNKTYAIKTIFVEGAAEDLNPDYLKLFPDKKRNLELADLLAQQGELTGAELFILDADEEPGLVSRDASLKKTSSPSESRVSSPESRAVKAHGIENAELYRKNYVALKKVFGSEPIVNRYLKGYESRLQALSSKIFSNDLRRVLSDWQKFEKGRREFMPYVRSLAADAKQFLKLDLESLFSQVEWPQITRLLVLQGMEKDLNTVKALEEKDKLLRFLKSKNVSPNIIAEVENFREQRMSVRQGQGEAMEPRDVLEALIKEAGPRGFRFSDYPAFSLYAGYLILKSELDAKGLFEEIKTLFGKILDSLAATPGQKALLELYRDEELARKLLSLELSRRDWQQALGRREQLGMDSLISGLKNLSRSVAKEMKLAPSDLEVKTLSPEFRKQVLGLYDTAFSFYEFARQRESTFYEKISEVMGQGASSKAVLITGGFHTDGMTDLFRENNISYGILTPRLMEKSDEKLYRNTMLQNEQQLFSISYLELSNAATSLAARKTQGVNPAKALEPWIKNFWNKLPAGTTGAQMAEIYNNTIAALEQRLDFDGTKGVRLISLGRNQFKLEGLKAFERERITVTPPVARSEARVVSPEDWTKMSQKIEAVLALIQPRMKKDYPTSNGTVYIHTANAGSKTPAPGMEAPNLYVMFSLNGVSNSTFYNVASPRAEVAEAHLRALAKDLDIPLQDIQGALEGAKARSVPTQETLFLDNLSHDTVPVLGAEKTSPVTRSEAGAGIREAIARVKTLQESLPDSLRPQQARPDFYGDMGKPAAQFQPASLIDLKTRDIQGSEPDEVARQILTLAMEISFKTIGHEPGNAVFVVAQLGAIAEQLRPARSEAREKFDETVRKALIQNLEGYYGQGKVWITVGEIRDGNPREIIIKVRVPEKNQLVAENNLTMMGSRVIGPAYGYEIDFEYGTPVVRFEAPIDAYGFRDVSMRLVPRSEARVLDAAGVAGLVSKINSDLEKLETADTKMPRVSIKGKVLAIRYPGRFGTAEVKDLIGIKIDGAMFEIAHFDSRTNGPRTDILPIVLPGPIAGTINLSDYPSEEAAIAAATSPRAPGIRSEARGVDEIVNTLMKSNDVGNVLKELKGMIDWNRHPDDTTAFTNDSLTYLALLDMIDRKIGPSAHRDTLVLEELADRLFEKWQGWEAGEMRKDSSSEENVLKFLKQQSEKNMRVSQIGIGKIGRIQKMIFDRTGTIWDQYKIMRSPAISVLKVLEAAPRAEAGAGIREAIARVKTLQESLPDSLRPQQARPDFGKPAAQFQAASLIDLKTRDIQGSESAEVAQQILTLAMEISFKTIGHEPGNAVFVVAQLGAIAEQLRQARSEARMVKANLEGYTSSLEGSEENPVLVLSNGKEMIKVDGTGFISFLWDGSLGNTIIAGRNIANLTEKIDSATLFRWSRRFWESNDPLLKTLAPNLWGYSRGAVRTTLTRESVPGTRMTWRFNPDGTLRDYSETPVDLEKLNMGTRPGDAILVRTSFKPPVAPAVQDPLEVELRSIRDRFEAIVKQRKLRDTDRLPVFFTPNSDRPLLQIPISNIRQGIGTRFTVLENGRIVEIENPMNVLNNEKKFSPTTVNVYTSETSGTPLAIKEAEIGILKGTITSPDGERLWSVKQIRSVPQGGLPTKRSEARVAPEVAKIEAGLKSGDVAAAMNPRALDVVINTTFRDILPADADKEGLNVELKVAFIVHGILELAKLNAVEAARRLTALANALGAEAMLKVIEALPANAKIPVTSEKLEIILLVTSDQDLATVKTMLAFSSGVRYKIGAPDSEQGRELVQKMRSDVLTWSDALKKRGIDVRLGDRFEAMTVTAREFKKLAAKTTTAVAVRQSDLGVFEGLLTNLSRIVKPVIFDYNAKIGGSNAAAHSGLIRYAQKINNNSYKRLSTLVGALEAGELLKDIPFVLERDGTLKATNGSLEKVLAQIVQDLQAIMQTAIAA